MATEKKSPALTETVLALSAKLKGEMTLDADNGAGSASKDIYEKTLPEDLTLEIAGKVHDHDANFIAAGAHAFGELAVAAMAKNKKLEQANISVGMYGKNGVDYTVNRSETFQNPKNREESIVKYGTIQPTVTYQPGRNVGQLKQAKATIGELAAAQLAK